jgi:hypothetical protein
MQIKEATLKKISQGTTFCAHAGIRISADVMLVSPKVSYDTIFSTGVSWIISHP